jgi:F0F1-type ATP synthase epsilon subunit
MSQTTLTVMIMTPEKVLFTGEATSVSSINDTGPFDILAGHSNFISLIKDSLIVRLEKGEYKTHLSHGVLRVFQGDVKVFLGLQMNRLGAN